MDDVGYIIRRKDGAVYAGTSDRASVWTTYRPSYCVFPTFSAAARRAQGLSVAKPRVGYQVEVVT